jgi:glycosyltransferase involved in cell wall biosynthesis
VTLAVDALAHAPGWRLLVVGDGDGASLERHAERAGVGDRVHVAGPRPDPGPYYAAADAFVLPTTYETFSLATYEAARARLPLVATPVSGVEDVLVDGRTGWAVERDAASIGAALRRLDDASARARMGEAAGTLAEAVAGDDLLEAHLRVYEEAAAR